MCRHGAVGWIALVDGFTPPIDACLNAFGERAMPNARIAAGRLVLKHGQKGRQALERVLRTGAPIERVTSALALAHSGHEGAFDVLKRELLSAPSDRKWLRLISQTLAWRYGSQLTAWVEEEGNRLADAHVILWTLARSRPEEARGTILELFRRGTQAVRAAALRILARQRGSQFLAELRRCLREGRPRKVAQEAFWQMLSLGDAAMPTVKEMLDSDLWTERKAALCLLRRWGKLTAAQKAHAQQDPHRAVRHAANWHPSYVEAARWHPKWSKRIRGQRVDSSST